MPARTEYHAETGRDFLTRARAYLAEDDLLQASEKGWGAAAQMVKAVAESRSWPHSGHRQLFVAIDRLADETGDPGLRGLFAAASTLHVNFYEGWLTRDATEQYLDRVTDLIAKLDGLGATEA